MRRSDRSRSQRRRHVKAPGGETRLRLVKTKHGAAKCGVCNRPLRGMPRSSKARPPRSKRTVSRPFGGSVCHSCLRRAFKEAARGIP